MRVACHALALGQPRTIAARAGRAIMLAQPGWPGRAQASEHGAMNRPRFLSILGDAFVRHGQLSIGFPEQLGEPHTRARSENLDQRQAARQSARQISCDPWPRSSSRYMPDLSFFPL